MTTTRKVAKYFAWTIGGVLALAIVLYLVMLAVNWRDQPASAASLELRRVIDKRLPVANIDNAYVYLLGFSAPRESDPQEAGERRLEWLQSKGYARDSKVPDPVANVNYSEGRAQGLNELAGACMPATPQCEDTLEKNSAEIGKWLVADALLLDRYRTLLQRSEWQEQVPFGDEMPLPMFSGVTDAQRLYLMSMWYLSALGDADAVRAGLDADLAFWRRVLSSSDWLITKMVAVSAIRQHFALGYLTLKRLPSDELQTALPPSWQIEISNEERSLLRPMAGELAFTTAMLRKVVSEPEAFVLTEDHGFLVRLGSRLMLPLFQPEDSINQIADRYLAFAQAFDVPLSEYPSAMMESEDDAGVLALIYNPIGDVLADTNRWALTRYPARVGDIEGMRRAALLALLLRSQNVAAENVADALQRADSRNPYNAKPFEWDAHDNAVVFVGLEEGERGRHRYVY